MREPGDLPAGLPPATATAVACLAAILEIDAAEVPAPPANHPEPWTVWRNWLAERGLGLVPIADPGGFSWAGPWLALLRGDGRQVCAVAYGPPSTIVWHPFGGPETFADVEAGYVVAPADVASWSQPVRTASRTAGRVEAIAIAADVEGPIELVTEVAAHAGRGLAGDRYDAGRGTFSNPHSVGHQLTLVEAEVLEELGFEPRDARRNLVTRGIDLNALVGRRFTVGEVECIARRLCEPCAHLERLSPGILRPLVHGGGLRADLARRRHDPRRRRRQRVARCSASTSARSRSSGIGGGCCSGNGTPHSDEERAAHRRHAAGAVDPEEVAARFEAAADAPLRPESLTGAP